MRGEAEAARQAGSPSGVSPAALDYLVVGHVTKDIVPGGYVLGGTVSFSSLTAKSLGRSVAVLTCCEALPELDEYFSGVALHRLPADTTTTFENLYTRAGRTQYVRAVAPPLPAESVPEIWRRPRVAHLGPIAREVPPEMADHFDATTIIGVTPQGWLRTWDGDGLVRPAPWDTAERVLSRVDVLIFSAEDVGGDLALVERYCTMAKLAVVTDHRNGCVVWSGGTQERFPAFQVEEVDPTGAGDVFATAFLLRLGETRDPATSARFANCAASFVVEGHGTSVLPTQEQVEHRLRTGKLQT
jgi:1D-myo-inositol 3-kinase